MREEKMAWRDEQHRQSQAGNSLDKRFQCRDYLRPAQKRPRLKPHTPTPTDLPEKRSEGTRMW